MQSESAGSIFSSEISAIRPANESATLEEGFSSFRNSAPQSRTAEESESGRKGLQISKNIFFDRESASWIMLSVWEKAICDGLGRKASTLVELFAHTDREASNRVKTPIASHYDACG